jgi:hypothetical protein
MYFWLVTFSLFLLFLLSLLSSSLAAATSFYALNALILLLSVHEFPANTQGC